MVVDHNGTPTVYLVGGWTNPCEKYESKWESSPIFGVKIKNISNHHLVYLLPSTPIGGLAPYLNIKFGAGCHFFNIFLVIPQGISNRIPRRNCGRLFCMDWYWGGQLPEGSKNRGKNGGSWTKFSLGSACPTPIGGGEVAHGELSQTQNQPRRKFQWIFLREVIRTQTLLHSHCVRFQTPKGLVFMSARAVSSTLTCSGRRDKNTSFHEKNTCRLSKLRSLEFLNLKIPDVSG